MVLTGMFFRHSEVRHPSAISTGLIDRMDLESDVGLRVDSSGRALEPLTREDTAPAMDSTAGPLLLPE